MTQPADGKLRPAPVLMFLPFAAWLAWVLDRRPTTLPHLAAAHVFLDLSLPIHVLVVSIQAAG